MKAKAYKDLILICTMGDIYMVLEGLWRGWTNISMLVVGGLCAFLIGKLNEHPTFYNRKMIVQCFLGTFITLFVEFISGMILNVWLKFHIWDYNNTWGNICGQICLPYTLLWFILMPLCIFTDDYLRYKLFHEEKPSGLLEYYKNSFTGK